jgi:L-amino acid N-acyltransferase YncA
MRPSDVPAAAALLNRIIEIGGTTAHQAPFGDARFADSHLGPDCIACHVVLDPADAVAGFQWLGRHDDLPEGCGDIATFTRRDPRLPGAGRALFAATLGAARAAGVTAIHATIRADNAGGLGYYHAMGFSDHAIARAVPLADGRRVDRISKRLEL